ncbi:TetR/AcrR family transcriptional regulator [Herbidospora mongoliensis]|uniref:TetR/AcrR family transcriptional regulator n=1 Tax=Herbidospora mongoliensis TaxID=688067 RepID=UPI00082F902E|nr:TetR/AcrR family transcriptional regulator [Herbidospora mongoliensis]
METLRERKKRETRLRISDIATGLFLHHGFDNVTVAEVARVADVSVNTVFNYFKTKEDLCLDRMDEAEQLLAVVVRNRNPGESAVDAIRRDLLDAVDTGDWRYGTSEGSELVAKMINDSPSLLSRTRELHERREQILAEVLADEAGTEPGDITPRIIAAVTCAVVRITASSYYARRTAGETPETILPDLRREVVRAFDLLDRAAPDFARARPAR